MSNDSAPDIGAFPGRLDDMRIYARTLGLDEIQALYHEGGLWP